MEDRIITPTQLDYHEIQQTINAGFSITRQLEVGPGEVPMPMAAVGGHISIHIPEVPAGSVMRDVVREILRAAADAL